MTEGAAPVLSVQRRAAWSLLAIVLAGAIVNLLEVNALAGLALSTVAVEYCTGKAGIAWMEAGDRAFRHLVRGLGLGLTLGLIGIVLAASGSGVSGNWTLRAPALADVAAGTFTVLLTALRAELLEHALLRPWLADAPRLARVAVLVVGSLAWAVGSSRHFSWPALIATGSIALLTSILWEERVAFLAVGARFAFLASGALLAKCLTKSGAAYPEGELLALLVVAAVLLGALATRHASPPASNVAQDKV